MNLARGGPPQRLNPMQVVRGISVQGWLLRHARYAKSPAGRCDVFATTTHQSL